MGVANGAEGLSTIVNPNDTPFLSCKPPSVPLKLKDKGRFLLTDGQLKELIGEHCWDKAETHAVTKNQIAKVILVIKIKTNLFETKK